MLNILIKSAVRRKVIGLFVLNPNEELYPRQVAIAIDESPHAVGLELDHLAEGGLLVTKIWGGHIYYRWNDKNPYASIIKSLVNEMQKRGDKEILSLPDFEQERRINKNLNNVIEDIRKYYDPQKIILFGSVAKGQIGRYSDIDLIIIKKTSLPYFKRGQQLVDMLDYDVDIDFLIYTPEEFEEALKESCFFQNEMLEKGEVVYEKAA